MAKKKYNRLDEVQDFVSNEEKIIEDIIIPAIKDHTADKVKSLADKGMNVNQIAATLMIQKSKVEEILK